MSRDKTTPNVPSTRAELLVDRLRMFAGAMRYGHANVVADTLDEAANWIELRADTRQQNLLSLLTDQQN